MVRRSGVRGLLGSRLRRVSQVVPERGSPCTVALWDAGRRTSLGPEGVPLGGSVGVDGTTPGVGIHVGSESVGRRRRVVGLATPGGGRGVPGQSG